MKDRLNDYADIAHNATLSKVLKQKPKIPHELKSTLSDDIWEDDKPTRRYFLKYSLGFCFFDVLCIIPQGFGSVIITNTIFSIRGICLFLTLFQIICWFLKPATYDEKNRRYTIKKRFGVYIQIIVYATINIFGSVLLYHIIAVLFGAPLIVSVTETFHFGLLLAVLTTLPACIHLGNSLDTWVDMFGRGPNSISERHVHSMIISSLLGSWFGAFPIPLDWDRPWQLWPITCCIGAIVGNMIGNLYIILFLLIKCKKSKRKHV